MSMDSMYAEEEEFGFCAACDREVSIAPRIYLFGDDNALCFECATKLDGVYDEPGSTWKVEPRVDGLLHAGSNDP